MNDAAPHAQPVAARRAKLALAYVVVGAAVTCGVYLYYAARWQTYQQFMGAIEFCDIPYCDFVLFYYEQAKVIAHAHAPNPMYFYPPTFALMLWPLGQLPIDRAISLWTWVQAASLLAYVVGGIFLLRRLPWWSHLALLVLALTSYPILHNWKWGQANTLFIALAVISLALPARAGSPLTALPVALATACRYFPGLYAFPFAVQRRWGVLVWFAALTFAILVLLPLATMGPAATYDFYRNSAKASHDAASTWVAIATGSQYVPTAFVRVFKLEQAGLRTTLVYASYALAALNAYVAARWLRQDGELAMPWAFCFVAGCSPLLVPTSWMHYHAYLPLTHAFLLFAAVRSTFPTWGRALALVLLWLPSAALGSVFFFVRFANHQDYALGAYVCFANLSMLALAHLLSLRAQRDLGALAAA